MTIKKNIFTRLRRDRRSQMFVATSLLVAFYMLSITVLLLEVRLTTTVDSDIGTVKEVYQSIQRESQVYTEVLLNRWQAGLETDTSAEFKFNTTFIPFLIEYALNYNVQAVIIPDFTPGFTGGPPYTAQFTLNVALYSEKTSLTSEFDIYVIIP